MTKLSAAHDGAHVAHSPSDAVVSALSYSSKILGLFGANLVDYRKLTELSGTSFADSSPKAHPAGSLTNVVLNTVDGPGASMGRGGTWDGTSSFANLYSAALNADFNHDEYSIGGWWLPSDVGIFTDGMVRCAYGLAADVSNLSKVRRSSGNNVMVLQDSAGGTTKFVAPSITTAAWHHFMLTVSRSAGGGAGELKGYMDGAQVGVTQTGLGAWVGALAATLCCIGAADTSATNATPGSFMHWLELDRAATLAEVVVAATPN